jgi:hypothetical protein
MSKFVNNCPICGHNRNSNAHKKQAAICSRKSYEVFKENIKGIPDVKDRQEDSRV